MADGNLGSIVSQGNVLRINNAFVEEVSCDRRNTGYLIISYAVPRQGGITTVERLRLNVSNNTVILNSFRLPVRLCDIRRGMRIDTTFSSRMTRSIPRRRRLFGFRCFKMKLERTAGGLARRRR